MVVRGVDRAAATLDFFTDARAAKAGQVAADPRVSLVAYDPAAQWQLRLAGSAALATTGAGVDARWAGLTPRARAAYATAAPPGIARDRPDAARGATDAARPNFALLTVTVDRLETLDLAVVGHRRARHVRAATGWHSTWLVP